MGSMKTKIVGSSRHAVMAEPTPDLEYEMNVSHKWLLVILLVLSLLIFIVSELQPFDSYRPELRRLTLLSMLLSGGVWLLNGWKPAVGRWAGILVLTVLIYISSYRLAAPALITLSVIPTALTAIFIHPRASLLTALGETLLTLFLARASILLYSPLEIVTVLGTVWSIAAIMCAGRYPVRQVSRWAWQYYHRTHLLLEEARDRKVELEQTLDSLAHANQQLTKLNLLAKGLRQAADEARRIKEEFVANVSHELRTPLNMITGFSETILLAPETYGRNISPPLLADLAVIHRNARHLSSLIDDVLDLSQIDAGQMALSKDLASFQPIIQEAVTAVKPLFDVKGLYLRAEMPPDPIAVFCDRTRICEVVLNLLSNAARFTDHGGVCLKVHQEEEHLIVSVADSGSGIADEDLSKLFQPFQQLDGSIRRRHGGTGLGLSISKRLIELHEGKIWVKSQEGVGTTFFVSLPIMPVAPNSPNFLRGIVLDREYLQRDHRFSTPKVTPNPRFVVLERGDVLQRLLTRYWNRVEIVPASTVEQVIEEVNSGPVQALLVNDASVTEALNNLLALRQLPDGMPVIICSLPGPLEASEELGVAGYLVKPVSRTTLLQTLADLRIDEGTILIVDDEPDVLHLYGRILISSGRNYRVLVARDGQEALHILDEHRPDLILLDLVMKGLDGIQLLEIRKQDARLQAIPVVVITARDPAGQPIVSNLLAITQGGGLSARRLLASIEALSQILTAAPPVGRLASSGMSNDPQVCE